MRLLIKFKVLKEKENSPLNVKLQGFFYSLFKDTKLFPLHNKKSYKFFCFSNLFGGKRQKKFIICSPSKEFLKIVAQRILKKEKIKIGENLYEISNLKFFDLKIKPPLKIITLSPIIIRVPKNKFKEYKIFSKFPCFYWRPEYPIEIFLNQLEANIFKKYKMFHQKKIEEFPIFKKILFKKSVALPLKIHKNKVIYIGSLWEFRFEAIDKKTKDILKFAIDCGFGEKNSMGFGFVNLEKI